MRNIIALCVAVLCFSPAIAADSSEKLPITKLAEAKLIPDLCALEYAITTSSEECQKLFNQGLGFFYSYVWMEAARSFETAIKHDPNCAIAHWGLSRAMEQWRKGNWKKVMQKAHELRDYASHREQLLIKARMQELGIEPKEKNRSKRFKAATKTIDELLAIYDDDEEGWSYRAHLAADGRRFGGKEAAVPFHKALLRINPLHPGSNHELVHFYENFTRPALGWKYSVKYKESSPGIPHAHHMQSHLAMRLGRWEQSCETSARGVELQRAYHKLMNVRPNEDHQFSHHLEVLFLSYLHDGRFREAHALMEECNGYGFKHPLPWFKLHMAERNYNAALKIAESFRKRKKTQASYLAALVFLAQNDTERAAPEIEVLDEEFKNKKRRRNKELEYNLLETRGSLMCLTGAPDEGLKLLWKVLDMTKEDYKYHAWGGGAYYMEITGLAALRADKLEIAEEAFLEALAHDTGSVRAALGMQALCEKLERTEEAARYAALARRHWGSAEVRTFDAEVAHIRGLAAETPTRTAISQKPTSIEETE